MEFKTSESRLDLIYRINLLLHIKLVTVNEQHYFNVYFRILHYVLDSRENI